MAVIAVPRLASPLFFLLSAPRLSVYLVSISIGHQLDSAGTKRTNGKCAAPCVSAVTKAICIDFNGLAPALGIESHPLRHWSKSLLSP
jgi:hypothetical protein